MDATTQFPGTLLVTGSVDGHLIDIFGNNAGLGKAVALAFASEGCESVFLGGHQEDNDTLAQVVADIQREHPKTKCAYHANPAVNESGSTSMVQKCVQIFGSVDYVVNIVDVSIERKPLLDTYAVEFDDFLEKTLTTLFFDLQAEVRQMTAQPRSVNSTFSVVNVSSVLGLATTPSTITESAGDHGIVALTRSSALDYARKGIRFNCVCPGARGDLLQNQPAVSKLETAKVPTGALCKVSEIVEPVVFLSSHKANGISGHALPVDSAWMLHHI